MPHADPRNEAIVILISLLVLLTLVEMWFSYRENRKYYETRDTFTNVYLTGIVRDKLGRKMYKSLGIRLILLV